MRKGTRKAESWAGAAGPADPELAEAGGAGGALLFAAGLLPELGSDARGGTAAAAA